MSEAEAGDLAGSLDNLSTNGNVSAAPSAALELAIRGEAGSTASQDRAALDQQLSGAEQQAESDIQQPMGEDGIETTVPTAEHSAAPIDSAASSEIASPDAARAAASCPALRERFRNAIQIFIVLSDENIHEIDEGLERLGIGGIILQLLLDGCLTTESITQMALDALLTAIPTALIAVLIEKIISMLIPAAGSVLAFRYGGAPDAVRRFRAGPTRSLLDHGGQGAFDTQLLKVLGQRQPPP
ncbi:hypothetical protein [Haliangium ochraceum]|uniref:Uncharacterized protein n=1 Tax=Haliangium ochraceum (strain DSM 14365 / JCM 11303 / SMP-2) TaxID=502025 RepID=D0LN42_HALO1|nr:hypothetical protein [Haliangium ochraceum]ACY13413.1 hypothetical protein Hoch_0797 [Haliangium ochraceum DSM 14365]